MAIKSSNVSRVVYAKGADDVVTPKKERGSGIVTPEAVSAKKASLSAMKLLAGGDDGKVCY